MKTEKSPRGRIEKIVYQLHNTVSANEIIRLLSVLGSARYSAIKYLHSIIPYTKHRNSNVRMAAIQSLCNISKLNDSVVEVLIDRSVDRSKSVRFEVYRQLDNEHRLRKSYFWKLDYGKKWRKVKSIEVSLIEMAKYSEETKNRPLFIDIFRFLNDNGRYFVRSLIEAISSKDMITTDLVVFVLCEVLTKNSIRRNKALLREKVSELQCILERGNYNWTYIEVWAATGGPVDIIIPILMKCLDSYSDSVRFKAIEKLKFSGKKSIPYLMEALNHKKRTIRSGALMALIDVGLPQDKMLSIIKRACNDRSNLVCAAAAFAAWRLGEVSAVTAKPLFFRLLGKWRRFFGDLNVNTYSGVRMPFIGAMSTFYGESASSEVINILENSIEDRDLGKFNDCLEFIEKTHQGSVQFIKILVKILSDCPTDFHGKHDLISTTLRLGIDESLPYLMRYRDTLEDKCAFDRYIEYEKSRMY